MSEKKQVKTKKVTKRRLNLKRVFLLIVVLCLLFLLGKELLKVNVSSVVINGNDYVSDSVLIKQAGLNEDVSYLGLNTKEICNKITDIPLVRTCRIKHVLDFKIEITVEENKPLFFYSNTNKLVLSNGQSADMTNTYGVPTLINYVPEKILNEFVSGLSKINSDIIRSISEIEYTPSTNSAGTFIDEERFMLSMNDGNTVYVNNRHIDALGYYEKVYASIGDKKGTFYFDCDFGNYPFTEYGAE